MKGTEKLLKQELSKHFSAQGQRLTMMTFFVIALIKLCTVNLSKLSKVLNPKVKKESNFKRLQRFVKGYNFNKKSFIDFVWKLFIEDKNQEVVLTIDRTNWKFGKTNINVLMLGIAYKGTCLPLIWKMLIKRGNSNEEERENLLSKFLKCLSKSQKKQIKCLVADREFIGYQWISYLKKEKIANYALYSSISNFINSQYFPSKQFGLGSWLVFSKFINPFLISVAEKLNGYRDSYMLSISFNENLSIRA